MRPWAWAATRLRSAGRCFLGRTVMLYAVIGIICRTTDAAEYYVAGRRVPALYNGMATGADWMTAASFIGLAGTLYLQGSGYADGPGLRARLDRRLLPGGAAAGALPAQVRPVHHPRLPRRALRRHLPRLIGVLGGDPVSFIYVVAQIYGVGLITTQLTGVGFEIGIFLGLGGILVCSFLGGMRAVTWTQVAQYIILSSPTWCRWSGCRSSRPACRCRSSSTAQQLQKVTEREAELLADPKELEVVAAFEARAATYAAKLRDVPAALAADRAAGRAPAGRAEGGATRRWRRSRRPRSALHLLPRSVPRGARSVDARARRATRRAPSRWAACRRTRSRLPATPTAARPSASLRRVAPQLPRAGVLPDGRHGRAAAHPGALLHHAVGPAGARVGDLVAVLHLRCSTSPRRRWRCW